jgi:amino acid transporter
MIVGSGVFVMIPLMLLDIPGPLALLGWVGAGALMLVDGLIWSELGAMFPGSGGSYLYLLEAYGPRRWGRLMAFLFVWQFLISGPLELGSGLISIAIFSNGFSKDFADFNQKHTWKRILWTDPEMVIKVDPAWLIAVAIGVLLLALLYRRMTSLKWLTVTVWLGVLAVIVWILAEGVAHFDPQVAFDFSGSAMTWPTNLGEGLEFQRQLGKAMVLAMFSYLGYYNICYIGAEVRDPGRTIPRSILISALLVAVLFVGVHLSLMGVVSWREVPANADDLTNFNLPAKFMSQIHGPWAAMVVTALLIWSCSGSAFAGLLGYSRIPYAAARHGHFFPVFGTLHPRHHIPHIALLFVGALTLFWTLFDLGNVVNALIATRILEQFIGQIMGVVLLRRLQPERPRPFRIWLYPVPCGIALIGWLYLYWSSGGFFVVVGLTTLLVGVVVFLLWAWRTSQWPFGVCELPATDGRSECKSN